MKYHVEPTDEYSRLVDFFIESELEFDAEDEVDTDILGCYKIESKDGELIGAAVLAQREERFICDGIAVNEKYRKKGIGNILLDKLIDEVVDRDGEALYLVARAPEFFRKYGFKEISPEDAPNFFECKYCEQYMVSCYPEIMKFDC